MRTFLTGATGHIGSAVLDAFRRAGHDVTALVRNPRKARGVADRGAAVVAGDLADAAPWRDQAADHDVFVHCASDQTGRLVEVDAAALDSLLDLAAAAPDRAVIYTSSAWVLGSTEEPASESAPAHPAPLVAWRPAHEQRVLDAARPGLRTMVVRPGIVYGGRRGIVADLLKQASNGLVRVVGDGQNRWATVYLRDLADLYVRLATSPDAAGIFHATDEAGERVREVVEAVARNLPRECDVRYVPLDEARAKMGAAADALALDQVVTGPRARALGWAPALRSITGNVRRLLDELKPERARR